MPLNGIIDNVELDQIATTLKRSIKAYEPEPQVNEKQMKAYEKKLVILITKLRKFHNY